MRPWRVGTISSSSAPSVRTVRIRRTSRSWPSKDRKTGRRPRRGRRMGDAAFKMDGHSMGLGLFLVFNLRKMHGRATSFISAVKVVFDPRKKINGGKTLEVWTKYPWPGLRAIPPPGMAVGLEIAAVLRRAKPTRDRFVRAYEHGKEE